jgi:YHS domain-containing protein
MKVTDPVCGMQIEDSDAAATAEYQGTTYYFCSVDCKEEFEQDPESYR